MARTLGLHQLFVLLKHSSKHICLWILRNKDEFWAVYSYHATWFLISWHIRIVIFIYSYLIFISLWKPQFICLSFVASEPFISNVENFCIALLLEVLYNKLALLYSFSVERGVCCHDNSNVTSVAEMLRWHVCCISYAGAMHRREVIQIMESISCDFWGRELAEI